MHDVDLFKIIVSLIAIILFSWGLFGYIVKRWFEGIGNDIRELYLSRNEHSNKIERMEAICGERHKK